MKGLIVSMPPSSVTRLAPTPSLERGNLCGLYGFQPYYRTAITEDEWEKAN